MQIRTMKLMLAVLGAMSMVLTGCPDGGREDLACTATTDCLEGEICHPSAKVCVQTCTTGGDCPESAKTCEAIGGGNTQMICKCSTDALCQRDERVADASTLKCLIPSGATNGVCAPAGTTPVQTSCDPANQPGTCSYGQICAGTGTAAKCEAAPAGTCAQATGAPTWDQAGGTAPVIISAVAEKMTTTNSSTQCGDGGPAGRITIKFYAPGGLTTHSDFTDLRKHVVAKLNASTSFVAPSFAITSPVANAAQGEMVIGFCGPSSATGAIYIANEAGKTSNVACVSWQ